MANLAIVTIVKWSTIKVAKLTISQANVPAT